MVLLGLHGNSTEGFLLKNLYCLKCSVVKHGKYRLRPFVLVCNRLRPFATICDCLQPFATIFDHAFATICKPFATICYHLRRFAIVNGHLRPFANNCQRLHGLRPFACDRLRAFAAVCDFCNFVLPPNLSLFLLSHLHCQK